MCVLTLLVPVNIVLTDSNLGASECNNGSFVFKGGWTGDAAATGPCMLSM